MLLLQGVTSDITQLTSPIDTTIEKEYGEADGLGCALLDFGVQDHGEYTDD